MEQNIVDVIIPTYKPEQELFFLIDQLENQTVRPSKIILMNTLAGGKDTFFAKSALTDKYDNIELHHIEKEEFDHGKTRDRAVGYSKAPFFLCLTQDVVVREENLLEKMLRAFGDESVAVCYARQMAREDSSLTERCSREFNYPDKSRRKTKKDLGQMGIKTYFCSNVCAMYRRKTYDELGGFVKQAIFNEDMIFASQVIKKGLAIYYEADAKVIHSHRYTALQQFHRNFDLGVSQADHPEVFKEVPSEKEGGRLVKQTLKCLREKGKYGEMVCFIYQSGWKYLGYRLGKAYRRLPHSFVKKCSMNKNYWI